MSAPRPICARACSFPCAHVVPVADVRGEHAHFRIDGASSFLECGEAFLHGWKLGAADHTEHVRLRHRTGQHAGEVRCVGKGKLDSGDVRATRRARGCDEDGLGKLRSNTLGGVLVLKAMPEHEIVALCAVLPELLLEFGGGLRLDLADCCAKAVPDAQESFVRTTVP